MEVVDDSFRQHLDSQPLVPKAAHFGPLSGGIPRHIHQVWISADAANAQVPDAYQNWPWSWINLNPGWTYTLWSAETSRQLVERHYPWFLQTYDALHRPVMKADAARYLYLHRCG